jgi:hypothetical protein
LKTPTATVEYRARSAMGVWYVAEGVLQPLSSDGVQVVLLISRDVTIQRARRPSAAKGKLSRRRRRHRERGSRLRRAPAFARSADRPARRGRMRVPLEMRAMRETIDGAWILVEQLQSFGRLNDLEPVHRVDVNETIAELASHHQRLAASRSKSFTAGRKRTADCDVARRPRRVALGFGTAGREAMLAAGLTRTTRDFAGAGRIAITTRDAAEVRSAAGLERIWGRRHRGRRYRRGHVRRGTNRDRVR